MSLAKIAFYMSSVCNLIDIKISLEQQVTVFCKDQSLRPKNIEYCWFYVTNFF